MSNEDKKVEGNKNENANQQHGLAIFRGEKRQMSRYETKEICETAQKHQTTIVREIVIKYRGPRFVERTGIAHQRDAAAFFRKIMPDNSREHFMSLYLDGAHTVVGYSVLTGLATSCSIHPREVFQPAILLGAVAVLVSHNHPSGKSEPSSADDEITKHLRSAADVLQLKLLDHIILGDSDALFSYAENGQI